MSTASDAGTFTDFAERKRNCNQRVSTYVNRGYSLTDFKYYSFETWRGYYFRAKNWHSSDGLLPTSGFSSVETRPFVIRIPLAYHQPLASAYASQLTINNCQPPLCLDMAFPIRSLLLCHYVTRICTMNRNVWPIIYIFFDLIQAKYLHAKSASCV